jgi:hypothetical protein
VTYNQSDTGLIFFPTLRPSMQVVTSSLSVLDSDSSDKNGKNVAVSLFSVSNLRP